MSNQKPAADESRKSSVKHDYISLQAASSAVASDPNSSSRSRPSNGSPTSATGYEDGLGSDLTMLDNSDATGDEVIWAHDHDPTFTTMTSSVMATNRNGGGGNSRVMTLAESPGSSSSRRVDTHPLLDNHDSIDLDPDAEQGDVYHALVESADGRYGNSSLSAKFCCFLFSRQVFKCKCVQCKCS